MALTKENTVNYEIVTQYKHIQVLEITHIMENGKEFSRKNHRRVITPDEDISNETDEIKGMADVLWTDAVKKAWDDKLKADAGG